MSWDRKRRGSACGYFYKCVRLPGRPHPVKIYVGRGQAGHDAAAEVEGRREGRREAKKLLQTDRDRTDEADRLAAELREWADVLLRTWLILSGFHKRRGQWRRKCG